MKAYGNYLIAEQVSEVKTLKHSGLVVPQNGQRPVRIKKGVIASVNDSMVIGGKVVDTKLKEGDVIAFNAAMGYEFDGNYVINIEGVVAIY